jgi:hypothetical protein
MARFKVAITKAVSFQGQDQEFANVYCYETGIVNPNFDSLADAIVAAEKGLFANTVSFRKAQIWDVGVPPNIMRLTKTLTGTGNAAGGGMYRECALLVKWPLPRSTAGASSRQRSLKKYLHTAGTTGGGGAENGATALGAISSIAGLQGYINAVNNPLNGEATLISPSGAVPNGPAVLHPYLEHRQFPRGRKEN